MNQRLNNLLKDPRTNWKFIWIVVILGFLAGAGILGYYSWWVKQQEAKFTEFLEIKRPEKVEDETADWKVYKNEAFGFEVKYPPNWIVNEKNPKEGRVEVDFYTGEVETGGINWIIVEKNTQTLEEWVKAGDPKLIENIEEFTLGGEKAIREDSTEFGTIRIATRKGIHFYVIMTTGEILTNNMLSTFKFLE